MLMQAEPEEQVPEDYHLAWEAWEECHQVWADQLEDKDSDHPALSK